MSAELAHLTPDNSDIDLLHIDNQLCFALYAATHAITNAYRPMLGELGLTYTQYLVLIVLWQRDGLSVGDLGAALRLDSGTLTPLLKRLEKSGLVRRGRRALDERIAEIRLTEAGHALKAEASGIRAHVVCRLGMNEAQIQELRSKLMHLITAMDKRATDPGSAPASGLRSGGNGL